MGTSSFNAHFVIRNIFFLLQYGEIVALIVSLNRQGSALVEFKTKEAAVSIAMTFLTGLNDCLTSGFVLNNHLIIIQQMYGNEKTWLGHSSVDGFMLV
jgi:hypothetical protein